MTIADKLTTIAANEQKVYEAGKQAEYDAFWDNFQENGNRGNYIDGFAGRGWTDETFRPKYNIQPTNAGYMFRQSGIQDLTGILKNLGIILDFSKCTSFSYFIQGSSLKNIGIIDTTKIDSLAYFLAGAQKLEQIERLILKDDGSQSLTNDYSFGGLSSLQDIVIEGCIGMSVSFQWSTLLTHDSLISIINALKDYSETSRTCTLTLGSTNLDKLSETEKAIATEKGWTLA